MRIAIVGGGPGGLSTAYLLACPGASMIDLLLDGRRPAPAEITLFEGAERVGGKIVTGAFSGGQLHERGVAEFYDYTQLGPDPLRELVGELGLATTPMSGPTVCLGDAVLREASDVRSQFGRAAGDVLEQFTDRCRAAITPEQYYRGDVDYALVKRSWAAMLDDACRNEDARRYVRVAMQSDLATEAHATNAIYGLHNFLMNEPDYMQLYSIDGGNDTLTTELAARAVAAGVTVKLACRVVRVELEEPGQSEQTWAAESKMSTYRVWWRDGADDTLNSDVFDSVVVALPKYFLPGVEWGGDELDGAMRRHHDFYDHPAHYLRVTMLFDRPFWRDAIDESFWMIDAFGGCCVYDESARHPTGDGGGVLSFLLAGEGAQTAANQADADLVQACLAALPSPLHEFSVMPPPPSESQVTRWIGTVSGLPGGCDLHAKPMEERHVPEPVHHPGIFVVGDYLFDTTVNGVLESAVTAVKRIQQRQQGIGVDPASQEPMVGARSAQSWFELSWAERNELLAITEKWTNTNHRRDLLIRRKVYETLTAEEKGELEELQRLATLRRRLLAPPENYEDALREARNNPYHDDKGRFASSAEAAQAIADALWADQKGEVTLPKLHDLAIRPTPTVKKGTADKVEKSILGAVAKLDIDPSGVLPHLKDVYDEVKKDWPKLSVKDFNTFMSQLTLGGSLQMREYTRSIAEQPHPEHAILAGGANLAYAKKGTMEPLYGK